MPKIKEITGGHEVAEQMKGWSINFLNAVKTLMEQEMKERAWKYLSQIGYIVYRETSISIALRSRNHIELVCIVACFESNHTETNIDIEVPLKMFELLVPFRGMKIENNEIVRD